MLDLKMWIPVDNNSTGYLGEKRNKEWSKRDEVYGRDRWKMGWLVEDMMLEYFEICELYGDAYYEYFKIRPDLLDILTTEASNVYYYSPTDIDAGDDYKSRGDIVTHIQDTAIRRCVKRFGRKFEGEKLIQIKDREGKHPLSLALSSGQVPFHRKELLSNPDNLSSLHENAWWLSGSVEDFYQRAKRLCVLSNVIDKKNQ